MRAQLSRMLPKGRPLPAALRIQAMAALRACQATLKEGKAAKGTGILSTLPRKARSGGESGAKFETSQLISNAEMLVATYMSNSNARAKGLLEGASVVRSGTRPVDYVCSSYIIKLCRDNMFEKGMAVKELVQEENMRVTSMCHNILEHTYWRGRMQEADSEMSALPADIAGVNGALQGLLDAQEKLDSEKRKRGKKKFGMDKGTTETTTTMVSQSQIIDRLQALLSHLCDSEIKPNGESLRLACSLSRTADDVKALLYAVDSQRSKKKKTELISSLEHTSAWTQPFALNCIRSLSSSPVAPLSSTMFEPSFSSVTSAKQASAANDGLRLTQALAIAMIKKASALNDPSLHMIILHHLDRSWSGVSPRNIGMAAMGELTRIGNSTLVRETERVMKQLWSPLLSPSLSMEGWRLKALKSMSKRQKRRWFRYIVETGQETYGEADAADIAAVMNDRKSLSCAVHALSRAGLPRVSLRVVEEVRNVGRGEVVSENVIHGIIRGVSSRGDLGVVEDAAKLATTTGCFSERSMQHAVMRLFHRLAGASASDGLRRSLANIFHDVKELSAGSMKSNLDNLRSHAQA
eukprot:CAMPEP_0113888570 /NCGR_PEP_ID=MMETSP0780_2-20120614/12941_1 /TAXON_ID=652834 /ORGANISM="Palpitomonas bilix" /LENGTH=579 /DNA_ID=CAMNT_0000877425 /DNA_START=111 /DNA_END=1850 /DNA_ORIENTATION=+ /assembly_acc=CAM_ASM_000599